MDNNDFLGSYAQENVAFTTRVIRTATVGDNFYKVMMFVENSRFVEASSAGWVQVPGSPALKALTVTASDYAEYTQVFCAHGCTTCSVQDSQETVYLLHAEM